MPVVLDSKILAGFFAAIVACALGPAAGCNSRRSASRRLRSAPLLMSGRTIVAVWGTKNLQRGFSYRLDREHPPRCKRSPLTLSKNLGPWAGVFDVLARAARLSRDAGQEAGQAVARAP